MKKAIVTGATGLVGQAVVKYLVSQGIDVLSLGRKELDSTQLIKMFGEKVSYLNLPMQEIDSLKDRIELAQWSVGDECVFFHFAWAGEDRLTDGDLEKQLDNTSMSANAVTVAKSIGCTKFVNAGTLQESYVQRWLDDTKKYECPQAQVEYALAKLAAKDMCMLVAYLNKIDYIHTRLSVPLDFTLEQGSYIATVLKKIAKGESYESPLNPQLFDIISTDDVARAYYMIGKSGKNKANYFIATAHPGTLKEYFEYFEKLVSGTNVTGWLGSNQDKIFDTSELYADTGFIATMNIKDILLKVKQS